MWCPLSPHISCNGPHSIHDIFKSQCAANISCWYIYLKKSWTNEIAPTGFRKYYMEKSCHNRKKKHLLTRCCLPLSPDPTEIMYLYRSYQMQIGGNMQNMFVQRLMDIVALGGNVCYVLYSPWKICSFIKLKARWATCNLPRVSSSM